MKYDSISAGIFDNFAHITIGEVEVITLDLNDGELFVLGESKGFIDYDGEDGFAFEPTEAVEECDPVKKTSRYDWSKIPEGYDWMATDKCGEVYRYNTAPFPGISTMWRAPMKGYEFVCDGPECDHWRDTLEQRPVETAPTETLSEHINRILSAFTQDDAAAVNFPSFPEHELREARPDLAAGQKWITASGDEVVLEDRAYDYEHPFSGKKPRWLYDVDGVRYREDRDGPSYLVRLVEDVTACRNCTWSTKNAGDENYACQRHAPPFYAVRADDSCGDWEDMND
jgi:hypothetical protein